MRSPLPGDMGPAVIIALAFSLAITGCNAWKISSPAPVAGSSDLGDFGSNLTEYLTTEITYDREIFGQVSQQLRSLPTASTCRKIATNRLIATCKSFTTEDGRASAHMIEQSISLNAARLAVCENGEGGAAVPSHCRSIMVPSADMASPRGFGSSSEKLDYDVAIVRSNQHGPCIKALRADNNFWISFSNNHQQGTILCKAFRFHVDRQELLELYAGLAMTVEGLSVGLDNMRTQAAEEHLTQLSRAEEIRALHEKYVAASIRDHTIDKDMVDSVMRNLSARADEAVFGIKSSLRDASFDISRLKTILTENIVDVLGLQDAIAGTYKTAISGISELAVRQLHDSEQSHELALRTQEAIEGMNFGELLEIWQNLSLDMRVFRQDILALQAVQMGNANLQLNLSDQNIKKQRDLQMITNLTAHRASNLRADLDEVADIAVSVKTGINEAAGAVATVKDAIDYVAISAKDIKANLDEVKDFAAMAAFLWRRRYEITLVVATIVIIHRFAPQNAPVSLACYGIFRVLFELYLRFGEALAASLHSFTFAGTESISSWALAHPSSTSGLLVIALFIAIYVRARSHRQSPAFQKNGTAQLPLSGRHRSPNHSHSRIQDRRALEQRTDLPSAEEYRFKRATTAPPRCETSKWIV